MFGKLKRDIHADVLKVATRDYVHAFQAETNFSSRPKVAFVVAQGEIMRGDPESSSTSSEAIESESFDKLLARVGADSSIKGVIVRIDSPGGESFASDELWRAMNQLARKKPMVISMSDTAASGGYYMAMNGTPVIAYPGTLTGSIGVVFGKPNLHGLYDKLGIDKDTISRGRFAAIDSDYKPLDDAEKAKLREGIDDNYHAFVQKVADSRKRPFDQIEPVAQGRVWLGDQAKDNGLVDELGGIDRAVQVIKRRASIAPSQTVSLVAYPAKRTLFEMIFAQSGGESGNEATVPDRILALLKLRSGTQLPPLLRSPEVRAWLLGGSRGGYLSVSPWALTIQ
jgi:protease-4